MSQKHFDHESHKVFQERVSCLPRKVVLVGGMESSNIPSGNSTWLWLKGAYFSYAKYVLLCIAHGFHDAKKHPLAMEPWLPAPASFAYPWRENWKKPGCSENDLWHFGLGMDQHLRPSKVQILWICLVFKKHPPSKFNHHNPWMSFFVGSRSLWVIAIPWHLWCISITSVTSQTLWYWPSWSRTQWFLKGYARNEYQSRSPASSHV